MTALALAGILAFFGEGSDAIGAILIVSIVGPVVLWLARGAVPSKALKDLFGISAMFFVLLLVTVVMMVVEHAGG